MYWSDAVAGRFQEPGECVEDLELTENCNVGWIAHRDIDRLILCHATGQEDEVDYTAIPVNSILRIEGAHE